MIPRVPLGRAGQDSRIWIYISVSFYVESLG